MQPKYTPKDIARFWGYVDKEISQTFYNGSRCWEWTAGQSHHGYGSASTNHKPILAHRLSYELIYGEIKRELFVLHHCDNRLCVNPAHLFLGTHQDNQVDKIQKGRQSRLFGESNGRCKLSDEQIDEIRNSYGWRGQGGKSAMSLARLFGVGKTQILRILHKKSRA